MLRLQEVKSKLSRNHNNRVRESDLFSHPILVIEHPETRGALLFLDIFVIAERCTYSSAKFGMVGDVEAHSVERLNHAEYLAALRNFRQVAYSHEVLDAAIDA